MTLNELKQGERCTVTSIGGDGALRQHFLDMGVIPGVEMELVKLAPMGDPAEFRLRGYELTLRMDDARRIRVQRVFMPRKAEPQEERPRHSRHPGLGEDGVLHNRANQNPLPEDAILSFALVGNQNCGKTTLFNQLTGARQHVGNFPGVTVDRKSGGIKGHPGVIVTDLPGIYSMSPYSSEELVSRAFILNEKPCGIINIVDATNIERNLYLTLQLLELDIPMVVALNMMDELSGNGGHVRVNEMERLLGVPVVPISAVKNEGVDELVRHALHVARYREKPARQDFCSPEEHGGAVHRSLHAVMHLIESRAERARIPLRFAAAKLLEGDKQVLDALRLSPDERDLLGRIAEQMESSRKLDRAAAMAEMRFSFIERVVAATVVKPRESKERERSRRIDRVLTGRLTAIPAFIGIMALIFYLTFHVIGTRLQELLAAAIDSLSSDASAALTAWHVAPSLHSLVVDGVFRGVGSVLSFLPIIVTLFFFLSLLEDSGYVARVAFVMDKPLRRLGLSGRSIVPMLIGFGCTVPAVMATRTLPSARDRRMTMLLAPFMSCSAKLPIYSFFAAAFFPRYAWLVMTALYLLGILLGILTALVTKNTVFRGEAVPFVMELPNYRFPSPRSVALLLWEKARDFIERAFSVIFIATILIWFLQHFDPGLNMVADSRDSMLALLAGGLTPVFRPLGLGDWRFPTALLTGFLAKESVVVTLNVLFGSLDELRAVLTPVSAAAMMVFCLLYTPCVAAIAAVKRELGLRRAVFTVVFQCVFAWYFALLVATFGSLIL